MVGGIANPLEVMEQITYLLFIRRLDDLQTAKENRANRLGVPSTMLRIGSMNMLLHGIEAPDIRYRDSLSEGAGEEEGLYSLVLANPPFAGSLDYEATAQNLLRAVKTKKTELLFLALFLRLLKPGGRATVIVPEGVLFGSSRAHKELRRVLVD